MSLRILMVCLGNICRSPLAEGILNEKARAAGLDWEIAAPAPTATTSAKPPITSRKKSPAITASTSASQRARKFTAADFQRFDKIYALAGDVVDDMRRIAGRSFDPKKSTSS
jgi:protein-tyrosine phosphatase